jgi:tetratricopeptide (TPR) repeat protein
MNIQRIAIIILIIAFLIGCKTSSKVTGVAEPKQQQVVILTEEKRIEFEYLYIEGLKQKMLGNLDVAIQYFNNCVEINPGSAASLYELASIHASKGELITAKLLLERAIEVNPDNRWYKLLLAKIYQNSNQFAQASAIYSDLLKNEPDNIDYLFLNALLMSSAGNTNGALKAYNELERIIGFSEQIALSKQHLYRTTGKNKEAYAEIEKLIALNPEVAEYYGIMADMYKEDGNIPKALEYYDKVLLVDPSNGFVYFSLATLHLQNKQTEKGIENARKGFSNPNVEIETKIQLYLMLSSAPDELKISDEQLEDLVRLIPLTHPEDARSYSIQADFYIHRNRDAEARDCMMKALAIDPNSYPLWEQLLITENQMRDFESMAANSHRAIELFPGQPLLYLLGAVSNLQLKNYNEALNALDNGQVYVIDNKRMEAQFDLYRAEAYYNLDKSTKAFNAFENVILNDPENYMALNNYAYYLSERGEQLEKAEIMSSKVIKANPDNPTYLDTHAWVLFKKKEYRLAKFYMENALKFGGDDNPVIVEHYGDILFMLNDVAGAVAYWQKAVDLGGDSETLMMKIIEQKYIEEGE